MLVLINFGDALDLKNWLIENYGILIRDVSDYRGLDNHCFRIMARTKEDDNQLVAAICEYKKLKEVNL